MRQLIHKPACFLWPDRIIRKRESRRIRDEHNATVNSHARIADALANLVEVANTKKIDPMAMFLAIEQSRARLIEAGEPDPCQ